MFQFIIILIVVVCVLLVLVVLAQNSKGGGLTSDFGGSSQIMGVKKTTDILEKITWGLAIALFVLSMSTTYFTESTTNVGPEDRSQLIETTEIIDNIVSDEGDASLDALMKSDSTAQ